MAGVCYCKVVPLDITLTIHRESVFWTVMLVCPCIKKMTQCNALTSVRLGNLASIRTRALNTAQLTAQLDGLRIILLGLVLRLVLLHLRIMLILTQENVWTCVDKNLTFSHMTPIELVLLNVLPVSLLTITREDACSNAC